MTVLLQVSVYHACLSPTKGNVDKLSDDMFWELITVDMLGVVSARPGCSTILMTQLSPEFNRL